ncbi:four helix bundle protein [bacterium (Candidatus Torokbacteria) CG09_land_8_20_14_0_10_42_11]|nr:MAG: four helix bundle protein [bacterium (Candidatus Torokbacteria) CG09_land_8_20_14_0_10_42_11]
MDNKIKNLYDLDAWKKSYVLVLEIYKITKGFPEVEKFGISSQLRRVASSVVANIAEGFARYHFRDKVKFYYQARGSVAEVQTFLLLSKDLNYINLAVCGRLGEKFNESAKLINGMIRSIEKQINI